MHPSKELRSEIRSFIEQNYLLGQSNNFADDASLLEHQVMDSTGVGLDNIRARYRMLTDQDVDVIVSREYFTVLLPLIALEPSNVQTP